MSYPVEGVVPHPATRRDLPMKGFGATLPAPKASKPSIAIPARRRSLRRILAAVSLRRRWDGPPGPGRRPTLGIGVSPIAGGATRGVTLLVDGRARSRRR